jgi:ribosome-binding protein aMBF1 (putative translation factor)
MCLECGKMKNYQNKKQIQKKNQKKKQNKQTNKKKKITNKQNKTKTKKTQKLQVLQNDYKHIGYDNNYKINRAISPFRISGLTCTELNS